MGVDHSVILVCGVRCGDYLVSKRCYEEVPIEVTFEGKRVQTFDNNGKPMVQKLPIGTTYNFTSRTYFNPGSTWDDLEDLNHWLKKNYHLEIIIHSFDNSVQLDDIIGSRIAEINHLETMRGEDRDIIMVPDRLPQIHEDTSIYLRGIGIEEKPYFIMLSYIF